MAGSQLNAHPCHHALIGDGAEGVMYVMDVTSRESLQAVDDWDRALSNVSCRELSQGLEGCRALSGVVAGCRELS